MLKNEKEDIQTSTYTVRSASQDHKHDAALEKETQRTVLRTLHKADNRLLAELGYKAEFKREFSVRICSCIHHHEVMLILPIVLRDNCLRFQYNGCNCFCIVNTFFSPGVGWTCRNGFRMAHSMSIRNERRS